MNVWVNEVMLVIAESEAGAQKEAQHEADQLGDRFPWILRESNAWRKLDDREVLTIRNPDQPVTRTAGEWASLRGAGFLATMEMTDGKLYGPEWLRRGRQARRILN
jgi:hypothetical protein